MSKISREQAEKILHERFVNKCVSFTYPGYQTVHGKIDSIAVEKGEIIIQMNNTRYTCSPESLNECLKLL